MSESNDNQTHRLLEATSAELVEAAERMDAGCRPIVPMLYDGLGADPVPPRPARSIEIDPDVSKFVAGEFWDAREAILGAGKALPLQGHIDLHLRFNALVDEIDDLGSILAERTKS